MFFASVFPPITERFAALSHTKGAGPHDLLAVRVNIYLRGQIGVFGRNKDGWLAFGEIFESKLVCINRSHLSRGPE